MIEGLRLLYFFPLFDFRRGEMNKFRDPDFYARQVYIYCTRPSGYRQLSKPPCRPDIWQRLVSAFQMG